MYKMKKLSIITALALVAFQAHSLPTYLEDEKEEKKEIFLSAYPNPISSVVNIRIADDQFQMMTLSLEDTNGKVILKDKITHPGVHTINMRLLSQGSYVLHLQSEDGSIDERKPIQKVAP